MEEFKWWFQSDLYVGHLTEHSKEVIKGIKQRYKEMGASPYYREGMSLSQFDRAVKEAAKRKTRKK